MYKDIDQIIRHSCGHRVRWHFHKPTKLTIQYGLRIIKEKPCPWCGAETGEPVPASVPRVMYPSDVAEVVAAERLSDVSDSVPSERSDTENPI